MRADLLVFQGSSFLGEIVEINDKFPRLFAEEGRVGPFSDQQEAAAAVALQAGEETPVT